MPDVLPAPRGRRRVFTVAAVADAALSVLDELGPDGLSVRSVAARLGLRPNALYTYVEHREDLERLIVERALAELPSLDESLDPRSRLRQRCLDLHEVLCQHPGAAALAMRAPMDGPAARGLGELLLGDLADCGSSDADAARAAYLLIVYVLGTVALAVAETSGTPPLPDEHDWVAARYEALGGLDPQRWPRTAAAREQMAGWVSREQFRWGLDRILAGLIDTTTPRLPRQRRPGSRRG